MILVAGESLIDLIVGPQNDVQARPGGGPFNSARTIARLGHATRFLGRFSADPFGQMLMDSLSRDLIEVTLADPVDAPTALAVVAISAAGVPRYWFHLEGTAGFLLDDAAAERALQAACLAPPRHGGDVSALHVGSLGLTVEPMATGLERLSTGLPLSALLLLDPNCRPQATADADAYRARVGRMLPRTDILKTSTEDLAFLMPGTGVSEAARALLDGGAGCVLVTDGPAVIRAFVGSDQLIVPVPPVEVIDTVGAGDAFGGAFLAWWVENGLARENLRDLVLLRSGIAAAALVASLTCGRAGAEPPWRHELQAIQGWGQPLAPRRYSGVEQS